MMTDQAENLDPLEDAKAVGYFVRNGQRVATLNAWRRWCRDNGCRCVVVIRGIRQDVVEVNGRVTEKVKPGQGEVAAARVVEQLERRGERVRCEQVKLEPVGGDDGEKGVDDGMVPG